MNAAMIEAAIRRKYGAPEWALFFEVPNGTGGHARRRADAIAMNLYPSRGLAIHGLEIKVTKADLRRELLEPAKADEIARYCDYWSLVTPKGLTDGEQIPMGWGIIEIDETGNSRTKKTADRKEAEPVGRVFVAAMLRRASEIDMEGREKEVEIRAMRRAEAMQAIRQSREDNNRVNERHAHDKLKETVREFEQTTGIPVMGRHNHHLTAKTMQALQELGLKGIHGRLAELVNKFSGIERDMEWMRQTADKLRTAQAEESDAK